MGVPACLLTIYCLSHISLKNLQIIGFLFIAFCFTLLAILYAVARDSPDLLFFVYCLLLFSLSFGPNVTTFILPAKTYPKKIRGTYNGISAACGKLGAIMGVYMFGPVSEATSYSAGKGMCLFFFCVLLFYISSLFVVMGMCAGFSVLGAILSYRRLRDD
jgi:PHS family inorganic phosphate transporter-like MFS transporter